jgi:4-diphosphocytidyl-2-C-methyl-D-erythritol kinase
MYAQLNVRNYTTGSITEDFLNMLDGKASKPGIGLYNVFEDQAYRYFTGLKEYKNKFIQAGAEGIHVAGSGPTLFSLTRDDVKAYDIHKKLLGMGLQAHLADF